MEWIFPGLGYSSRELNSSEEKTRIEEDYSLYTGIFDLDKIICGLHNEELTIIGARPRNRKDNICFTNS